MSVWGANFFENDDAADWLADLKEKPSLDLVQEAILEIVRAPETGYFEIPECSIAVAAAEILCELFGVSSLVLRGGEALMTIKKELDELKPGDRRKLITQASGAVELVLADEDNSELRQVLEDDEALFESWSRNMKDLGGRLSKVAAQLTA